MEEQKRNTRWWKRQERGRREKRKIGKERLMHRSRDGDNASKQDCVKQHTTHENKKTQHNLKAKMNSTH